MNANRGMFLETVIERTIEYYKVRNIAYISKRYLPIKVYSFNGNRVTGWLNSKTQTDYYGVYKGRYLDFEAKQTQDKYLPLSNIKNHQIAHLENVSNFGAISFLIVYFVKTDEFYGLSYSILKTYLIKNKNKKSISLDFFKQYGIKFELIYPGILDLEEFLNNFL